MIGSYLIQNEFKLIKVVRGQHMAAPILDAIDEHFVLDQNVVDGVLPNKYRARPYLTFPYKEYFCDDAPNCDLECRECYGRELDAVDNKYWQGWDIGFLTGSINGIVVIDIDPRNIANFTDMPSFIRRIENSYGVLPTTWTVETGRGGRHLYYRYKHAFKSDKGATITGVDFLGENSWCRLPPYGTKHGSYKWLIPPSDNALADLPRWVVNIHSVKRSPQIENMPKPKKTSYDDKDERSLVEKTLNRIPISVAYDHETFCTIGYALCSSGYADLFEQWSQTDPDKTKWVTKKQLNSFSRPGAVKLGSFFSIGKSFQA